MNTTKVNEHRTKLNKTVTKMMNVSAGAVTYLLVSPNEKNRIKKVESHSKRLNQHQISSTEARDLVGNKLFKLRFGILPGV